MLEARDLKKQFMVAGAPVTLFEHLAFSAKPGEFIIITGRSGSGKSTLLYQLGLLDTPSAGEIMVDDMATSKLSKPARTDLRLDQFGYVFQDYGLMPEMTALDNVLLPLIMRGESAREARQHAQKALERVGLQGKLGSKPAQLSGGQQQRVSIARAIAHDPTYLLADEPTANLDSGSAEEVLQMFGDIHRAGTAVIMVTHERSSLSLADRVLELHQGALVEIQPGAQSTGPAPQSGDIGTHSL